MLKQPEGALHPAKAMLGQNQQIGTREAAILTAQVAKNLKSFMTPGCALCSSWPFKIEAVLARSTHIIEFHPMPVEGKQAVGMIQACRGKWRY